MKPPLRRKIYALGIVLAIMTMSSYTQEGMLLVDCYRGVMQWKILEGVRMRATIECFYIVRESDEKR